LFFDLIHGTGFGAVGAAHPEPARDLDDVLVAFLTARGLPVQA
jgi:hypothetical protein